MEAEMFKNIKVENDEPLIEDITREFNRGMWTIGYTGQSPERMKLHQQNWHTFHKTNLKAEGGAYTLSGTTFLGGAKTTATDGIEWRQNEQVIIARGDARAVRGGVTVEADRLLARYRPRGGTAATQARTAAEGPARGGEIWRLETEGKTAMLVAIDGRSTGVIAVADTPKPGSAAAIEALRGAGIEVVMITGDNARTAEAIGATIRIDRVLAEVLPQDKASEVRRLQQEGRAVAMVGDGINYAPALAQADVGIAIGTGTDVAIEAADVTLVSGDLRGVVDALDLSRATMRNILQNLVFAFGYNSLGIPLAAGALYPFLGIRLSPIVAAAAMALSSLSVVMNANRLRAWRRPELTSERDGG